MQKKKEYTQVPQRWCESIIRGEEPALLVCTSSMEDPDEITKIHHFSGHPGVQKMCYFI